ncbi:DNA damage-binding protein 1 [Aphelenchoides fujianensis]|nr:DNA damage-binding protein 1 [Aphelenchoides fujianensis]
MEVDPAPEAPTSQRQSTSYIVSAQKPTVVNGCVVGNFRNEQDLDLVIARINRIELLLITEEGLKPYRELPIFGRIAIVRAFKAPGEKRDSLLILTCKYHMCVLSFEPNGDVRTRASGNVSDRVARQAESGILASIHHRTGLIALRLYDGLLKIVQWSDERDLTCFNIRFADAQISDFTFLEDKDPFDRPSIAYIYQDSNGRHLRVCSIDTREKEFQHVWKQDNIETEASLLIPIPFYGGVVVVGQESISYHKDAHTYTAVAPPFIHVAQICCYAHVDENGERMLLGDVQGRLYMLVLIQLLGEISTPECLCYLDNSVVFVGSRLGDSQLIRILPEANEYNAFIDVIDSYPNLGPIRDLLTINADGQTQIVTCSGAFKEGSLREISSIDLSNIRQLFALALDSPTDNFLVVSFVNVTHLFNITEENWEDVQMEGFDLDHPTLFAGILRSSGNLLQITNSSVNLISKDRKAVCSEARTVSMCAVNVHSGQILLANGHQLAYVETDGQSLRTIAEHTFARDISCLDLATVDENSPSRLAAVGLWDDNVVCLFSLDEGALKPMAETAVVGDVLARSMVLTRMEGTLYLLVALGDGTLFYFHVDEQTGELSEEKKTTLGSCHSPPPSPHSSARLQAPGPMRLKRFNARSHTNIFACSDRPAVIFSSNQKLVFSNVNLKSVTEMCPLNSQHLPNSLALADSERLFIGQIDDIQKLHIRSVPLGESVSRIAHQPETQSIAILTSRVDQPAGSSERVPPPSVSTTCSSHSSLPLSSGATSGQQQPDYERDQLEVHSICILDMNTFDVLHTCELPATEWGLSLCAAKLGEAETPYYVVGTAYVNPDEPEVKLGRILVFAYDDKNNKLRLVQEKEVKGAVFGVSPLHNKLVAAINSSVRLFAWRPDNELRLEASSFNFTTALHMKTKGDIVLVGDLIRSVTMLAFKHTEVQFEEVARDYMAEWTTTCEIIDSDSVIAGENAYNLYTCHKSAKPDNDDDRIRFHQTGYWYLGENVNVFRLGNLHSTNVNMTTPYSNPVLYGTSDGGPRRRRGSASEGLFKYLEQLQQRIAKNTNNCTRVSYDDYRNFFTDRQTVKHAGFVDGDLIEGLADLPREKVAKIIAGMEHPPDSPLKGPVTPEEVLRLVEDLSRLH